jgi:hypothetical protein
MSNIKLDFSKFKHVSSDDKSTTLKHYEGHTITMMHNKLSKANKEQLMALAQKAKDKQDNKPKAEKAPPKKLADGGAILKEKYDDKPKAMYADGGDVEQAMQFDPNAEVPDQAPQVDPQQVYQQKFNELKQTFPNQPNEVIDRTVLKDMGENNLNMAKEQQAVQKDAADRKYENEFQGELKGEADQAYNAKRQAAGLPPVTANQGNVPAASIAPPPQATQPQMPQSPQQQAGLPQPQSVADSMNHGYNTEKAGIYGEAAAAGALGKAQAAILEKQANDQQVAIDTFNSKFKDLDNERKALMEDVKNGYVSPEKYWTGDAQGNGSHSRLMAGIGMILAGFNPTSSPNAAMEFLNKQMDANINAQKANLDSKQNLLSANLKQFGNLRDATEMTRLQQSDMVINKLKMEAAKAQNPMAAAAANKAAGQLEMDYAPRAQQFAMQQAMMHMANNPAGPQEGALDQTIAYLRITNPAMAKEMEERRVHGIGMANRPIPQADREKMQSYDKLQNAANDLMQYSKNNSNLLPGTANYNYGVTKAMAFQQMVREGLLGTVFRESEKPLLEKFVKENPAGAFKAFTTQPQLRAIMDSNKLNMNSLKDSYGLPVQKEAATRVVNGVTYQQGPKGWHKVK